MLCPDEQASLPPADYVSLNLCGFASWWSVILCVYVATLAYNAAYAKFYLDFDNTLLSYTLGSHDVGMSREHFRTIAHVHIGMATIHGVCALSMVVGSLRQRTLAFSFSPTMTNTDSSKQIDKVSSIWPASFAQAWRYVVSTALYKNITDRHGVLGVNGKYFNITLTCCELFETGLHTIQAIRMSKFLSSAALIRFYVCLLVAKCWSSAFIYSRWFWKDEARRRFAAIACDCALDLMSTLGVSIMIVSSYVDQYNFTLTDFEFYMQENDQWMSQMLSEAQMVVVVSWLDLASRMIFSLGLIVTTTNMKELLYYSPRSRNRVTHHSGPTTRNLPYTSPSISGSGSVPTKPKLSTLPTKLKTQRTSGKRNNPRVTLMLYAARYLLAAWGIVVLILHVDASVKPSLVECMSQVHPIAGTLPSCRVLRFDCHQLHISGEREVMKAKWDQFEPSTVTKLEILHCPALEVPERFQKFSQLVEIRVYNSTIVRWGAEAAITTTHHPDLTAISLVRVNMTDGLVPLGFQSFDFPFMLNKIVFCETNLQTLPDELDTKWHVGSNIYVENSKLTVVPPVLLRLQPNYLTLAGNAIEDFPPELFEIGYLQYIILGGTSARRLPENVTQPITGPAMIDISNTNISFFWSWIDPLVENMIETAPAIFGGGSTYCLEREDIMSGLATAFSEPFETRHSSLLMNASETNWETLLAAVDCSPAMWKTQLPLKNWDETYAITDGRRIAS